jgi:hypothetical protein
MDTGKRRLHASVNLCVLLMITQAKRQGGETLL